MRRASRRLLRSGGARQRAGARDVSQGLVEPANEQARALAERLAGRDARYLGSVNATNLKVSGVHVFSAGDFLGEPGTESVVLSDQGLGTLFFPARRSFPAARISFSVEHWASGQERPASARRNSRVEQEMAAGR